MALTQIIPDDYICPISLSIMDSPYIHKCGRSLDLLSVQESFKHRNTTCPFCRENIING